MMMINKLLENNTLMVLLLAGIFLTVCVLLLNWAFLPTMDGIEWREEVYQVQEGDSLWSISRKFCPESVDRREWSEEIRALNNLPDSTIRAGQTLIILTANK